LYGPRWTASAPWDGAARPVSTSSPETFDAAQPGTRCRRQLSPYFGPYDGRRGRTWITLTPAGSTALADEIGRLELLITRVETADAPKDR
jgi:hypothetical protein